MPGLVIASGAAMHGVPLNLTYTGLGELSVEEKILDGIYQARFVNTKFIRDKVFRHDDDVSAALDGVVFNLSHLMSTLQCPDAFGTMKALYSRSGDRFFVALRGEFAGFLYDRKRQRSIIFTNPTGSKPLYYYYRDDLFVCASQLDVVVQILKAASRPYSLDVFSAYCLLTFGFMLEDHTLVSDIKRLRPGHYMTVEHGGPDIRQYAAISNEPLVRDGEREIVERLDALFQSAVVAAYDKDQEYDYDHLATLSGGLDSRMNVFVAAEHGYKRHIALTFSQNDYLDERIAKAIAADLGMEFIFQSLNGGRYLITNFQDAVRANGGLVLFAGAAHLLSAMRRVNMRSVGMLHMGQLGGGIMGAYLEGSEWRRATTSSGAYSSYLIDRIAGEVKALTEKYESEELFVLYNRGFNGVLNGNWMTHQFTECTSPFLDWDFLTYAMRVPRALRFKNNIYRRWILTKHPAAARYPWEKIKTSLRRPSWWQRVASLAWKARIASMRDWERISMNPFGSWYKSNPDLRGWVNNYWRDNAQHLEAYPEIRKDCESLLHRAEPERKGPLLGQTQVLTLLEAVKLYWT